MRKHPCRRLWARDSTSRPALRADLHPVRCCPLQGGLQSISTANPGGKDSYFWMFAEEEIEVQGDHTVSKRQEGILIRVCVEPEPLTLILFCVLVSLGVLGAHRRGRVSV